MLNCVYNQTRIYMKLVISLVILLMFGLGSKAQTADGNEATLIKYANSVIALTNTYYQKVNAYQKKMTLLERDRDKANVNKETPILYKCASGKTQTTRLFREATNPPTSFSTEDATFLKDNINAYRAELNELDDLCYTINDDIEDCNFKEDEFVSLDSLMMVSNQKIEAIVKRHQVIVKRVMNKTTEAEKVIDKESPLGPLTTPMKTDLRLAKSILDKILNYTPDNLTAVKMEVLRLRTGIAKSEAMKELYKNEFDKKYTSKFDDFYKSLKYDFADTANDVGVDLEKAAEKGNYKKFAQDQQRLLEQYNELIKIFNLSFSK